MWRKVSEPTRVCVCFYMFTHWELRRQGEGDGGHERLGGPWRQSPQVCLQTVRWSQRLWWSSPEPHWTTWRRQSGGKQRGATNEVQMRDRQPERKGCIRCCVCVNMHTRLCICLLVCTGRHPAAALPLHTLWVTAPRTHPMMTMTKSSKFQPFRT